MAGAGSTPTEGHSSTAPNHCQTPDDPQPHSLGGGLQTLNEEIVEDAIARVLQSTPEKALGVAVAWVEKKGKISKELVEDGQSTEQQKKFYKEVLKNVYT